MKDGIVLIKDIMHPDGLRQSIALIRFYFHVNVEDENGNVDVDKLAKSWGQLKFALQFHGKMKIKETIRG